MHKKAYINSGILNKTPKIIKGASIDGREVIIGIKLEIVEELSDKNTFRFSNIESLKQVLIKTSWENRFVSEAVESIKKDLSKLKMSKDEEFLLRFSANNS